MASEGKNNTKNNNKILIVISVRKKI